MTAEENKALVRRLYAAISAGGQLADLDDICVPSYVHHIPEDRSLGWLKSVVRRMRTGFPDVQFRVDDLIAEGDRVWSRWTFQGTHLGPFEDIEPTGLAIEFGNNFNLFRVADGRLVEDLVCWGGNYRQLVGELQNAARPAAALDGERV
jgi:predicted ester cyclase